jgi:beta-phosphoglucomutase-like phosphatase (HAD superfamily)
LKKYFIDDHIFTKIQVPKPKPAPDLFHFACTQMGVSEGDTLIIEDSPAGVTAARAAGIHVLGYIGTTHDKEKQAKALKGAGADAILEDLIHIHRHLPA